MRMMPLNKSTPPKKINRIPKDKENRQHHIKTIYLNKYTTLNFSADNLNFLKRIVCELKRAVYKKLKLYCLNF